MRMESVHPDNLDQGASLYHRKVTNTKTPPVIKENVHVHKEHQAKDKPIQVFSWIFVILFLVVTISVLLEFRL